MTWPRARGRGATNVESRGEEKTRTDDKSDEVRFPWPYIICPFRCFHPQQGCCTV